MWSSTIGLSNLNNGLFSVLTSVFLIQLQQKVVMLKIRKFLILNCLSQQNAENTACLKKP